MQPPSGRLGFRVAGGAVSVDPATAEIGLDLAALAEGLALSVAAYGADGAIAGRWRLTIAAAPELAPPAVVGALADRRFVHGAGPAVVEAGAAFAGERLGFAVQGGGATVDAGSGRVMLPADTLRDEEAVTVTASNAAGSAAAGFRVTVAPALVPPVATEALPALVWPLAPGARTVSAAAGFRGEGLVFALEAAPAGATIDAGTGLVTVPTAAPLEAAPVMVVATNAAGSARQSFAVTVRLVATVFDSAAALAEMSFLSAGAAPSWNLDAAGGFARLVPASEGATHGLWSRSAGDGRYRALVRWTAGAAVDRPVCLGARLARSGADWSGLRVEALALAGATRLEVRQYAGAGTASSSLGAAAVAWAGDVWSWIEVELDGTAVRARLYPEAAAAPDWQVVATTSRLAAGAVGIGGFGRWGQRPQIDLRRMEFLPLVPAAPAAADAGEWTLEQRVERA